MKPIGVAESNGLEARGTAPDAELARHCGLPVISYEGGLRLDPQWRYGGNKKMLEFCNAMVQHPRIARSYRKCLLWREDIQHGGTHTAFVDCGSVMWGHPAYQDQPISEAPEYMFLREWIEEHRGAARQAGTLAGHGDTMSRQRTDRT